MDIVKKLSKYQKAYSPMYKLFVSIKKVRVNIHGIILIDCEVPFDEGSKIIMFRESELQAFTCI